MKIIKVIYNSDNDFIINIVHNVLEEIQEKHIVELYNVEVNKERRKAIPLMTAFGTTKTPLIVFADENLENYNAIWSESSPNWEQRIKEILDE